MGIFLGIFWWYSHNSSNCFDILFLLSFPYTYLSLYSYLEMSFTSLVGILISMLFRRGGLNLKYTKIYQYYLFSLFGADPPCFNSNWALFVWVKISGAVLNFYKNNILLLYKNLSSRQYSLPWRVSGFSKRGSRPSKSLRDTSYKVLTCNYFVDTLKLISRPEIIYNFIHWEADQQSYNLSPSE